MSVSGEHEWRASGPGDIRGPCAGLNAAPTTATFPVTVSQPQRPSISVSGKPSVSTRPPPFSSKQQPCSSTETHFQDSGPLVTTLIRPNHSVSSMTFSATGLVSAHTATQRQRQMPVTRGDWLAPDMNSNCASYPEFAQELLDLAKSRTGGNINPQVSC